MESQGICFPVCHNKWSQTWWLKIREFSGVLEASSQKQRFWWNHILFESCREESFSASPGSWWLQVFLGLWLCCAVLSGSVVSDSLWSHEPHATLPWLLCPWAFSRQEYWSGLPCPPPGELDALGTESPALQTDSLPPCQQGSPGSWLYHSNLCLHLHMVFSVSCPLLFSIGLLSLDLESTR